MALQHHTPEPDSLEDAVTALFCVVDDVYPHINPRAHHYASLKRLSDSEVITLTLVQQLRGVDSCRSFLRDAGRFFSHLFPGVVGLHPSSLHRRVRKLGRYLEPLRRSVLEELVGESETLFVDSTLIDLALFGALVVCTEFGRKMRQLWDVSVQLPARSILTAISRQHGAGLYHLGANVTRYYSLSLLAVSLFWPPLLLTLFVQLLLSPVVDHRRLGPGLG